MGSALQGKIREAQTRLRGKLLALDPGALGVSEYNQRYLGGKLKKVDSVLWLYGWLLEQLLGGMDMPPEQVTLVDYGGGSGVITYLACELGVGTVIYNDIYEVSCQDVAKMAGAMGLKLEHVVPGDLGVLIEYVRGRGLAPDAILSYDVLEHIYDVPGHFRQLPGLSDKPFHVLYASGANIRNAGYVREVTQLHLDSEMKDREKQWGHKERDALESFLEIRRAMIAEHAPELPAETVEMLAKGTRGLMKPEILACVDRWRETGKLGYVPDHPTNTCDPHTGNWQEHLMDQEWLRGEVEAAGFEATIGKGRHSGIGRFKKRMMDVGLNVLVDAMGEGGMKWAPFYMVQARRPRPR